MFKSPLFFRFLDEFGDGFGMAQAISYVDHSQLLTYMALEERLAQAMEVRELYGFLFFDHNLNYEFRNISVCLSIYTYTKMV